MQYVLSCMILAFAGAGVWLLVTGIKGFLLKRKHLPHVERVEGTIVDIERKTRGTSTERGIKTTIYANHPVIQFASASGEAVTFTSEEGDLSRKRQRTMFTTGAGNTKSTASEYQKGDKVMVLYDPDGAIKPMIDSGSNASQSEIMLMLGGVAFVAVALFIIALFGGRILAEMPF